MTIALVVAVSSAIFAPLVLATSSDIDSSTKLVTFYDGNTEKTILTKGQTVAEALTEAEIKIGDNDKVSPAVDSKIKDSTIVVNIKRARPVTVVDNEGKRSRVVTADTDKTKVAAQAGMDLKSHDTAEMSAVQGFISDGGAGQQMEITRAKTVNLTLYGQSMTLRTQKETIAEMLTEAGIKLSSDDTSELPLTTKISEGLSFRIWRNGIQTIEQDEDVQFETQVINDSTKKVGYREVQTAGQNGRKKVIYQVNMQDGIEISREKISEVITTPAVTQIEIVGTKVELPPGSHSDWMRMAGISESDFGYVNFLVSKESGWNPLARNKSSGACGLPQALPCSKMASFGSDYETNPITQLKWMASYVNRYGGWQGAYNFWQSHHWY